MAGTKPRHPGSVIETLFEGVSASRFFLDFLPGQALCRRGSRDVLTRLGLADLRAFTDARCWTARAQGPFSATLTFHEGARQQYLDFYDIDLRHALRLYGKGATVVFRNIDRWLPAVRDLQRRIGEEIGAPDDCGYTNMYISPTGRGVPPHFDAHPVFVLQIEGSKRWRIAPNRNFEYPAEDHNLGERPSPTLAAYCVGTLPTRMPRESVTHTIRPGSALFVPAGAWHDTHARGPSLSLSIAYKVPRLRDIALASISRKLLAHAHWREPAFGAWGSRAQRGGFERKLSQALERLSEDLGGYSADRWMPPQAVRAPQGDAQFQRVPGARVRLQRGGSSCTAVVSDATRSVEITLDPSLGRLVTWIGRRKQPFTIRTLAELVACPDWLRDPQQLAVLLATLGEAGMVQPAHAGPAAR